MCPLTKPECMLKTYSHGYLTIVAGPPKYPTRPASSGPWSKADSHEHYKLYKACVLPQIPQRHTPILETTYVASAQSVMECPPAGSAAAEEAAPPHADATWMLPIAGGPCGWRCTPPARAALPGPHMML